MPEFDAQCLKPVAFPIKEHFLEMVYMFVGCEMWEGGVL